MSGNGYKVLGYVVWHTGKWYLRRRLPAAGATATATVAVLAGVTVAVLLARRSGS